MPPVRSKVRRRNRKAHRNVPHTGFYVCVCASGSEERRNAHSMSTEALDKGALRDEFQGDLASQVHFFKVLVAI